MSFFNAEESTVLDFDTAAVEPRSAPQPMPIGDYRFLIEKSVVQPNSNGNGKILKLTLRAQDDPHTGRVVFDNLNVQNANAQAQQIAREHLAGLLAAVGMTGERDMSKLAGKEVVARLGIQPAKEQYDARNVVKGYKPLSGVPLASTLPHVATPAKQAPGFMSKGPALK